MDLMEKAGFAFLVALALGGATCGGGGVKGVSDAASVSPDTGKTAVWKLVDGPTVVSTEAELYNRLDGGAPKYIERGWVSSTFAEYRKDGTGTSLQCGVHDMGSPVSAETMFNTCLPAIRSEISFTGAGPSGDGEPNAVVDLQLSGTYAAYGFGNRYFIELNTDAKTDAALADVSAFMLKTLQEIR